MLACPFNEAVIKDWVEVPEYYEKGYCVGGPESRRCCQATGRRIHPTKRAQVLAEAYRMVSGVGENDFGPVIYLGVLGAVGTFESETGNKII